MQIKNTRENYGVIAKCFHWITALLILGSYTSVYYRHWFTEEKTPENWNALQLHLSIGISIGVIVLLRVIWRSMNTVPDQEPGTVLQQKAAKIGHYVLYALIIIMPITGYLGTGAATDYFFMFEIAKFSDTAFSQVLLDKVLATNYEDFEKVMDFIHKDLLGECILWILILGHIGMALYHHYVKQDRTLKKMTSGS